MVKTLKMLRYISISLLLLVLAPLKGQIKEQKWVPTRGFTIGVNLAGPINQAIDNHRGGISFLSRIWVRDQWLLMAEAGFESVLVNNSVYNYASNGTFLKAGLEYDVFKNKEPWSNDNMLFGLHYGYALQEHGASAFYIQNGYWGNYTGKTDPYLTGTHWIELSGGPRVELFKNVYLGWTLQLKLALFRNNSEKLAPYLVPGFGNGDNSVNGGFSFSLEYMIPWKQGGME
jgi:hypothetical protein